jgi:hypothetical protein
MSSELKSSISTLETPSRADKTHSLVYKPGFWKSVEASDFDFIKKIGTGKFS